MTHNEEVNSNSIFISQLFYHEDVMEIIFNEMINIFPIKKKYVVFLLTQIKMETTFLA